MGEAEISEMKLSKRKLASGKDSGGDQGLHVCPTILVVLLVRFDTGNEICEEIEKYMVGIGVCRPPSFILFIFKFYQFILQTTWGLVGLLLRNWPEPWLGYWVERKVSVVKEMSSLHWMAVLSYTM